MKAKSENFPSDKRFASEELICQILLVDVQWAVMEEKRVWLLAEICQNGSFFNRMAYQSSKKG